MRGTVVLEYLIKFRLCAVILCCAGCGVSQQAQVKSPSEQPILQAESQEQEVRLSFADAYPENWEHQFSQRARLSR